MFHIVAFLIYCMPCIFPCILHVMSLLHVIIDTFPSKLTQSVVVFVNTLKPKQNGRHIPDDIFQYIFLNEKAWILIKISLNFVPKGRINNIPALFQIMVWHRPGDRPLSEPVMVRLLSHIYVTRPWWVKSYGCIRRLGAVSIRKTVLPGMAIPMLKIRRPNGRLIFDMEIAIRR